MASPKKITPKIQASNLLPQAYALGLMPSCYTPCPPFYDFCNNNHPDDNGKCAICEALFGLVDYIE